MEELMQQIRQEMKEIYLQDDKEIIVAYSGGKDSNLVLTLLWQTLESIPLEQRTKKVHVICSDTGVETPAMTDYVHRTLLKIQRYAEKGTATSNGPLPIQTHLVKPDIKSSFWYKCLGRGTLVPTGNVRHRWCTHHLKITPTQQTIKNIINQANVSFDQYAVTLWLGVRVEESARRRASIEAHALSAESKFAKHSEFSDVLVYHPIKYVTADELWFYLLDLGKLPYGLDVQELSIQYGESMLECGMKTSNKEGVSCGSAGSRSGCWTCGMVKAEDPMLQQLIAEGYPDYVYLLEWKKLFLRMRNDIRYREVLPRPQFKKKMRELSETQARAEQVSLFEVSSDKTERLKHQYHSFQRVNYEEYAPGAMTFEGRKVLLEYLLYIQQQTGYTLISEEEIQSILDCWKELEGIVVEREDLIPQTFDYDGELIYLPTKRINDRLTKTPNPIFYVDIDMNMGEGELYTFLKERQRETQKSLFFFPKSRDFSDEEVVWNQVSFVVCRNSVQTQLEAYELVYRWLGWEFGRFTEKTKHAALQHLLLSAIGDAITTRRKRKSVNHEPLDLIEEGSGQFSFAI